MATILSTIYGYLTALKLLIFNINSFNFIKKQTFRIAGATTVELLKLAYFAAQVKISCVLPNRSFPEDAAD